MIKADQPRAIVFRKQNQNFEVGRDPDFQTTPPHRHAHWITKSNITTVNPASISCPCNVKWDILLVFPETAGNKGSRRNFKKRPALHPPYEHSRRFSRYRQHLELCGGLLSAVQTQQTTFQERSSLAFGQERRCIQQLQVGGSLS